MTQAMLSRMLLEEGFTKDEIIGIILMLDNPGIMGIDFRSRSNLNHAGFSISRKTDGEGYWWDKIP